MGAAVIEATFRPFTAADIPAAAALAKAHQPAPWSEGIFGDEIAQPDRIYLVAEADSLIGFAGIMVIGDEAHVTNLLVSDERRRQGIGRALLASLIAAAVDRGARHLTLEVRSKNTAAMALYAQFGLAPVGLRKGYYGDDDALILWAHDIGGPEYGSRIESWS
jgi:[ribosomal protein S18]-alanine N-acetyltransferase